jgi:hypothetical protein
MITPLQKAAMAYELAAERLRIKTKEVSLVWVDPETAQDMEALEARYNSARIDLIKALLADGVDFQEPEGADYASA